MQFTFLAVSIIKPVRALRAARPIKSRSIGRRRWRPSAADTAVSGRQESAEYRASGRPAADHASGRPGNEKLGRLGRPAGLRWPDLLGSFLTSFSRTGTAAERAILFSTLYAKGSHFDHARRLAA